MGTEIYNVVHCGASYLPLVYNVLFPFYSPFQFTY